MISWTGAAGEAEAWTEFTTGFQSFFVLTSEYERVKDDRRTAVTLELYARPDRSSKPIATLNRVATGFGGWHVNVLAKTGGEFWMNARTGPPSSPADPVPQGTDPAIWLYATHLIREYPRHGAERVAQSARWNYIASALAELRARSPVRFADFMAARSSAQSDKLISAILAHNKKGEPPEGAARALIAEASSRISGKCRDAGVEERFLGDQPSVLFEWISATAEEDGASDHRLASCTAEDRAELVEVLITRIRIETADEKLPYLHFCAIKIISDHRMQNFTTFLSASLSHKHMLARKAAAGTLGSFGTDESGEASALGRALSDPMPEVQSEVAWALARVRPDAETVNMLVSLLNRSRPEERLAGLRGLREAGAAAAGDRVARDKTLALFDDDSTRVRGDARLTAERHGWTP